MPLIRFKYAHPDGTPMSGTVHATPTRRHHRDDRVILPAPMTIDIGADGEATADLAPTGDTWVWEFREHMNLPHPAVVHKMVPDQTVSLDFTDLVEVDPRSLQETATPEARWWAELRANNATAQEVRDIRDLVLPARDQTLAARDQTLAHNITVDTSVGTRVFIGDTMIYGDTGLRDVSSLLQPGWNAEGSTRHAILQRVNNKVYFQAWVNKVSDESSYPFALPNGFGSAWYTALGSGRQGSSPVAVAANGSPRMTNIYPPVNAGQNAMLNLMFHTSDPWPTSLPGVPA